MGSDCGSDIRRRDAYGQLRRAYSQGREIFRNPGCVLALLVDALGEIVAHAGTHRIRNTASALSKAACINGALARATQWVPNSI